MGKRERTRAQVSLEFAIVMGFVTLLLIPMITFFFYQVKETNDQVSTEQAYTVAKQIVDEAETVYYMGTPSRSILKVYIPNHVESIQISGNSVVFKIKISGELSDVEAVSRVPLYGNISNSEGLRYIRINATGSGVEITG